jgi:hypothetical protein
MSRIHAGLLFSPGFSPALLKMRNTGNRLNGFRGFPDQPAFTGLKPGENENGENENGENEMVYLSSKTTTDFGGRLNINCAPWSL